jgi:hypothetical protein
MNGTTMSKMAPTRASADSPPGRMFRAAPVAGALAGVWLLATASLALAAPPAGAAPAPPPAPSAAAAAQPAPQTSPQKLQEQSLEDVKKRAGITPDTSAPAPAAAPGADTRGLDQEIQGLKKDVVDLNKDLFMLEEELLFPANTQVAVFLSMDVGEFFGLDSVTLKIDQKEVVNYLYTPREADALRKGGVQRLYLGNLKVGEHELVALFSGTGPNERAYKRGASIHFEKGVGAKYLELKINDRQSKLQPEFEIKDWE